MFRLIASLALLLTFSSAAAGQQYTATPITSANSPIFFANLVDLNNKGQVLGAACIANCGVNPFPAVWANGVYQALPIPPGYQFNAPLREYKINDSGDVVGAVLLPTSMTSHVVLWQNGTPTLIEPPATLFPGCSGTPSSTPSALNSSGHILILTAYTADPSFNGYPHPGRCYAYWIYPTGNSTLSFPFPPQCLGIPDVHGPLMGYDALPKKAMNDADQVLENILNSYCGPPYVNPAPTTTYDPAVIQPGGSFSYLPATLPASSLTFGGGSGARAEEIDNLGIVQGFADNGALIWDGNGVHVLGPGLVASLNNVGQALYAPGNSPLLWQSGVATSIQFPPGISPVGGSTLNDAGQITAADALNNFYLLTPSGTCGQDVTSQTQVTAGGFRYNHATTRFTQAVTVTSAAGSSVSGPISLAFDNLPARATLIGINGATQCLPPQGSQYTNLTPSSLASGGSVSAILQFFNVEKSGVSYRPRVIAGLDRR